MGQKISLSTRHGRISAWRASPHDKPRAAVIVIHEIFGLNAHMRHLADRFAALGYLTIAPALFDRIHPNTELAYDEAGITRGREIAEELGFNGALDGVRAAYDSLEGEHRVATVGFSWGGTVAFLANTRIGLPGVSYYGSRTVPFLRERLKAPMLFHFGAVDELVPPEDVEAHREQLPSSDIITWPAGHGFNCEQRESYNQEVAQMAMTRTLGFLRKHLQHTL